MMRRLGCFALLMCLAACSEDEASDPGGGANGGAGAVAAGGSGANAGAGGSGASGGAGGASGSTAGSAGSSGSGASAGTGGGSAIPPYSKGKFIPSFAVKYGSPGSGARSVEETAKFDLLITGYSHHQTWAGSSATSWKELEKHNPEQLIFVYMLGPAEYNTVNWGDLGYENGKRVHGWEWMKQNHGIGQPDQWIEAGTTTNLPLYNTHYPNERIMQLGNSAWIEYYRDTIYSDLFGGGRGVDLDGVDGIFCDNTSLTQPIIGNPLKTEGTNVSDEAASYDVNGSIDIAKWKTDYEDALRAIVPVWRAKDVLMIPNFSPGSKYQISAYQELEAFEPSAEGSVVPFGAMEEGGFISPYGSSPAYYSWSWADKLAGFKAVKETRVLNLCHGPSHDGGSLSAMDVPDSFGTTGWDALWFCVGSFMLGFDDVRGNGYLAFTAWGYLTYRFFEEFDPDFLHLGKALGDEFESGGAHLREFEDGWFAVNPTTSTLTVKAPGGASVRVIDRGSLKDSSSMPLVQSTTLGAKRAVVLLKDGKLIGNGDN